MPATDVDQIRHSALWSHLVQVVADVVSQSPEDGMGALVSASHRALTGQALPPKTAHISSSTAAPQQSRAHASYTTAAAAAASAAADIPADILTNTVWASHFTAALAPPKPMREPRDEEAAREEDRFRDEDGHRADEDENEHDSGDTEDGEEEAAELPGVLADVMTEQRVFNELGAGLPAEEALRLMVGLRQLLRSEPLSSVRFWGKIMGRWKDYYIAETKWDVNRAADVAGGVFDAEGNYLSEGAAAMMGRTGEGDADYDEAEEEEEEPVSRIAQLLAAHAAPPPRDYPAEPSGTGLNECVYYVADTRDATRWRRLGDVTPRQIAAARRICHGFTGNLDAPVHSHPRFIGREQHYLRAQIARITAACRIAPRDVYTTVGAVPDEDEDEAEESMQDGGGMSASARDGYSNRRSNNNSYNNNKINDNKSGQSYSHAKEGRGGLAPSSTRARVRVVAGYAALPPLLPREMPDEEDTDAVRAVQAWYRGYPNDELLQGRYWVHIAPTILQQGRVTAMSPDDAEGGGEGGEEEDGGVSYAMSNAAAPPPSSSSVGGGRREGTRTEWIHPFLSEVASDEALVFPGHSRGSLPAWSFRSGFRNESSVTGTYLARSTRWFGAMTYAITQRGKPGAQYQMMYIGTGLKNRQEGEDYVPEFAQAMMREYVDNEVVLALPRDCTADEELEYAPPPPAHGEEEKEDANEGAEWDDDA